MPKFRKKLVVIDAMQYDGTNAAEIAAWAGGGGQFGLPSDHTGHPLFTISTLEGRMTASAGDWIIKGIAGEVYPCKPEIFSDTYEPADKPMAGVSCVFEIETDGQRMRWEAPTPEELAQVRSYSEIVANHNG